MTIEDQNGVDRVDRKAQWPHFLHKNTRFCLVAQRVTNMRWGRRCWDCPNRLTFWRARPHRLGIHLRLGQAAGLSRADTVVLVRYYRRAQREAAISLDRQRRIRVTSFNLNAFSSQECLSLLRFRPPDLGRLVDLLAIDVSFPRTRFAVGPIECFAIVLLRLASPARWVDLEELFGRSGAALCHIFYSTVWALRDKWGFLLCEWRVCFMRTRASLFSENIAGSGAYLDRCVGFIDGTAISIARPGGGLQRACYSGHKRKQALKFQNVLTPDGLFFHLFGPFEGRRLDMTLYHESVMDSLLSFALVVDGSQYYLYGDAAYMICPWLQAAFSALMTPEQEECNGTMKVPRTAVEWRFKDVKQTCSTLDYPRKLKVGESPVGLLYHTAALVWDLRCCAYVAATSTFFTCPPPRWEEYLGLQEGGTGGVAADSADDEGQASVSEKDGDGAGVLPAPVNLDAGSNADGTGGGADT